MKPVNTPTESKGEKALDLCDIKKAKRAIAVICLSTSKNLKHIVYEAKFPAKA